MSSASRVVGLRKALTHACLGARTTTTHGAYCTPVSEEHVQSQGAPDNMLLEVVGQPQSRHRDKIVTSKDIHLHKIARKHMQSPEDPMCIRPHRGQGRNHRMHETDVIVTSQSSDAKTC